ncbi:MAG: AI-2E family transporter [Clostridia bacterium]|nr:AI-2E family transporter [Clostridia bacterium]
MGKREEITVNVVFLGCLILMFVSLAFPISRAVAAPLMGGALLYLFAKPFVVFFARFKIPYCVSVISFYVLLLAALIAVIVFLFPLAAEALNAVIEMLPERIEEYFNSQNLFSSILDGGGSIARCAGDIAIAAVLSFYFLRDSRKISKMWAGIIPLRYQKCTFELFNSLRDSVTAFFRGQSLLCIILAVLESIMLLAFKIPYAVLLGIIGGLLDIIPYFGATLGFVPICVVTFLFAREKIIYIATAFVIIQLVEGSILAPRISSASVGLSPISVIIALIIGSAFASFWGMLLSVPFAAVAAVSLKKLFRALV